MFSILRVSTICIIGASVLIACGGGGGSTPPTTPTTGSNGNAPVAIASSASSKVTEGGEFTITAAESSDADGDNLSFTWTQTAGPNVLTGGSVQATSLVLNAPIITQDTVLTFEVSVSDGTNTSTDTINITAEPLGTPVTVRPSSPINTDLAFLNAITNEGTDQYRIYWIDGYTSQGNNAIASQVFTDDGSPAGSQSDGGFQLPQTGSTSSTQILGLFPLTFMESGGTIHSPTLYFFQNAVPHLGNLIGPFQGNLSPVDDPFFAVSSSSRYDHMPIGQNSLLNVSTLNSSVDASIQVDIFNPDGSIEGVPAAYEEMATAGDPSATVSTVSTPAVSAIDEDGYIVAWYREDTSQSPFSRTIEAQIYTSDNTHSGQTIAVDATAGPNFGNGNQLDVAKFENGNSLITWVESQNFAANGDYIDFVIRGRVVSPDGSFASDEFSISESVNDQFVTKSISLSNGDILVIWGEGNDILKARLVTANGPTTALGSEFDLSETAEANVFFINQTETGRVVIGYNSQVGNTAITSEVISFCPVGCQ